MPAGLSLGEFLKQRRGDRTQQEVAEAAGISRNYLSQLEHDRFGSRVPHHTLEALAAALDLEPGLLKALAGLPIGVADVSGPRPDFTSFVRTEPTLDEDGRNAILAVYAVLALPVKNRQR